MGLILNGAALADSLAGVDKEMAKRAPQPRTVEARSKPLRAGLAYDGSPNDDPKQSTGAALYDYDAIKRLIDIESLFARACWKYVEQIWSQGWEFISKNKPSSEYISTRFKQMEYVSGITTLELFNDIATQLVLYSNVYIRKIRNRKSSGGQIREEGGRRLEPIAAYVVLDAPSVRAVRDKHGVPLRYEQTVVTRYPIRVTEIESIKPEDMIHIAFRRQAGYAEGTPMVIPIIDDIASLRRMEETAEIIAFQASIPVFHFKAGHEKEGGHASQDEVDLLESQVNNMLAHGALVTNERANVEIHQAKADIATILEFIAYYRGRVLAGFGISPVLMGEASTSNRNTSVVVASEMQQTTKMMQSFIQDAVTVKMITELLLEGAVNIFDDYYMVKLFIPPIDSDAKRAEQIHALAMFEGNLITEDEARQILGHDPITEEGYNNTFLKRVTIPKIMAQGEAATLGVIAKAEMAGSTAQTKSVVRPTNQYGTKPRPSKAAKRDELWKNVMSISHDATEMLAYIKTLYPTISDYGMDRISSAVRSGSAILQSAKTQETKDMVYDDIYTILINNLPEEADDEETIAD